MTLSGSSPIGNSWRLYDSTSSPSWLSPDEIGITGEPDLQFNIWGSAMMTTGNFHIQNSTIISLRLYFICCCDHEEINYRKKSHIWL
jgi:hypothetical protein